MKISSILVLVLLTYSVCGFIDFKFDQNGLNIQVYGKQFTIPNILPKEIPKIQLPSIPKFQKLSKYFSLTRQTQISTQVPQKQQNSQVLLKQKSIQMPILTQTNTQQANSNFNEIQTFSQNDLNIDVIPIEVTVETGFIDILDQHNMFDYDNEETKNFIGNIDNDLQQTESLPIASQNVNQDELMQLLNNIDTQIRENTNNIQSNNIQNINYQQENQSVEESEEKPNNLKLMQE